jgi:hypothetical protein
VTDNARPTPRSATPYDARSTARAPFADDAGTSDCGYSHDTIAGSSRATDDANAVGLPALTYDSRSIIQTAITHRAGATVRAACTDDSAPARGPA